MKQTRSACVFSLLVILILATLSASAFAAEQTEYKTHVIDALNLSIELPSDWFVLSRDTPSDSELLKDIDVDYEQLMSFFQERSVYLSAFYLPSVFDEFSIISLDLVDTPDLTEYSEQELEIETDALIASLSSRERVYAISETSISRTENDVFIVVDGVLEENGVQIYALQYFTIRNNKGISFTFRSPYEISSMRKNEIRRIIQTVKINTQLERLPSSKDTSAASSIAPTNTISSQRSYTTPEEGYIQEFYMVLIAIALPICYYLYCSKSKKRIKNRWRWNIMGVAVLSPLVRLVGSMIGRSMAERDFPGIGTPISWYDFLIWVFSSFIIVLVGFVIELADRKNSNRKNFRIEGVSSVGSAKAIPTQEETPTIERELSAYKRLLDNKLISQDDYDAKKKQILGL